MRGALIAALLLTLAACGRGTDATGATPSESRQLNEAAAMLDANSVDANAVDAPSRNQP
jgi:hypothetical protein